MAGERNPASVVSFIRSRGVSGSWTDEVFSHTGMLHKFTVFSIILYIFALNIIVDMSWSTRKEENLLYIVIGFQLCRDHKSLFYNILYPFLLQEKYFYLLIFCDEYNKFANNWLCLIKSTYYSFYFFHFDKIKLKGWFTPWWISKLILSLVKY